MKPRFKCVRCKKRFVTQAKLVAHTCEKGASGTLAVYITGEEAIDAGGSGDSVD